MNTSVTPFLTEKAKTSNNIILTENSKSAKEDGKICRIFKTYFTDVTKGLNLRVVEKDQSFENEERTRSIKYHYGN